MKISFLLLSLIFLCCCSSSLKTTYHFRSLSKGIGPKDGLSYETAIIVFEETESKGIAWEHVWLNNYYPNYKVKLQSLSLVKKHTYDIFDIVTREGKEMSIFFDICNFFGKH